MYIYIWDKPKNREATRFFPTLRSPAKARDKQAKSDVLDLRSSYWRALSPTMVPQEHTKNDGESAFLMDKSRQINHGGFQKWGYPKKIAGWFMSWKIPSING